jgi:hypothetical protein
MVYSWKEEQQSRIAPGMNGVKGALWQATHQRQVMGGLISDYLD